MKDGLKYIVGKRIASVFVASSGRAPKQQVFLVFTDGTRLELYGDNFTCCSGCDKAEGIESYVKSGSGKVDKVYAEGSRLEALMEKDLQAWRQAKMAIQKAKTGLPPARR